MTFAVGQKGERMDLISRQAAIEAVSKACFELRGVFGRCEDALKALPTAQPKTKCIAQIRIDRNDMEDLINEKVNEIADKMSERKKGEWIAMMSDVDGVYWACSECGEVIPRIPHYNPQFDLFPRLESIDKTNFCPNCGADMRGEKETER